MVDQEDCTDLVPGANKFPGGRQVSSFLGNDFFTPRKSIPIFSNGGRPIRKNCTRRVEERDLPSHVRRDLLPAFNEEEKKANDNKFKHHVFGNKSITGQEHFLPANDGDEGINLSYSSSNEEISIRNESIKFDQIKKM